MKLWDYCYEPNHLKHMKIKTDETGNQGFDFLTQDQMEGLIYMNTDIWITPELKRFKRDLLKRVSKDVE